MEAHNFFSGLIHTIVGLVLIPLGKRLFELITLKIKECEHQALKSAADILVSAANQMFKDKEGSKKMEYVAGRLKKKFPWASHAKIREFSESKLSEIKNNKK